MSYFGIQEEIFAKIKLPEDSQIFFPLSLSTSALSDSRRDVTLTSGYVRTHHNDW